MSKYVLDACALVAQASVLGGTLLTSDHHELEAVDDNEDIGFLWFR